MPRECSEGQDGAGKSAREMLKASKRVQKILKYIQNHEAITGGLLA